ncbi:hypothetical protein [Providencia rettgeri]
MAAPDLQREKRTASRHKRLAKLSSESGTLPQGAAPLPFAPR